MNKYEKALKDFEVVLQDIFSCDEANMDIDTTFMRPIQELVEQATPENVYKEQMLDTYDTDNGCKDFEYENQKCPSCNALLTTENDRYDCWINPTKINDLKFCPNCGKSLNNSIKEE